MNKTRCLYGLPRTATLAASAFCLVLAGCGEQKAPPAPPVPEVQVATVLQRDVPVYFETIGQTRGSEEVEIRARVEGFLETVNFQEGTFVKEGDLLFTIDPRSLQANLDQASGNLTKSEASHLKAKQDVERYQPLVAQKAIARQIYDNAVATEKAAKAAVEAARAAAESAKISLAYARIEAPVSGLIGKTDVRPGNLVGRGENTLLTTISKLDPIRVRTSISEADYLRFARRVQETGQKLKDRPEAFQMVLADGSVHAHRGRLAYADATVDPATGTLLVEAEFPNPQRLVRSGQYARLRVTVAEKKDAILIPQRAVQELQSLFNVAVVGPDDKVEIRPVKPGERVGSLWVIAEGLKSGERIVVEGLQKVRAGVQVKPMTVEIEMPDSKTPAPEPKK